METPTPIIPAPAPENLTENSNTKKITIGVTVVAVIAVAALFGGQLFKGSFIADDLKKGLKSADFSLTVTRPVSIDDFKGTALFSGHQTVNFSDTSFGNFSGSFKLTGTRSNALVKAVMSNPEYKKFFDLVSPDTIKNTYDTFATNITALQGDLTSSVNSSTISINDPQTDDTTKKILQADIDSLNLIANNLPKALAAMQQLYDFIQTLKDGAKDLPATIASLKILTSNFKMHFDELKQTSVLISDKNSLSSFQSYLNFTSTLSLLINSDVALSALEAAAKAPALEEKLFGSFSPPKDPGTTAQVNIIEHNVNTFEEIEKTVITLENKPGAQENIVITPGSVKGLPAPELFTADALQKFYKGVSLGSTALNYRSIFTDIASQLIGSDAANVCKGPFSLNVQGILFDSCTFDAEGGVLKSIFLTGKGPGDSVYDLKITEPTYAAAGSGTGLDIAAIDPNHPTNIYARLVDGEMLQIPASFMINAELGDLNGKLIERSLFVENLNKSWDPVIPAQPDVAGNTIFCIKNVDPTCNESKVSTQHFVTYTAEDLLKVFDSSHIFVSDTTKNPEYHLKFKVTFIDPAMKEKNLDNNEKLFTVPLNYFVDKKQQGDLAVTSSSFIKIPNPYHLSVPVFQATLPAGDKVPLTMSLDNEIKPFYTTTIYSNLLGGTKNTLHPKSFDIPKDISSALYSKLSDNKPHVLRMVVNMDADGKITDFAEDNFAEYSIALGGKNTFTKLPIIGPGGVDQIVLGDSSYIKDPKDAKIVASIMIADPDPKSTTVRASFKGPDAEGICLGVKVHDYKTGTEILHIYGNAASKEEGSLTLNKDNTLSVSDFSLPYKADFEAALKASEGHFDVIFNDVCSKGKAPYVDEDNLTDNIQHYYLPVESSKNAKNPPVDGDVKVLTANPESVVSGSANVSVNLAPTTVGTAVNLQDPADVLSFDPPLAGITATGDLKFAIAKVPDVVAPTPYKLMIHKNGKLYAKSAITVAPKGSGEKVDLNNIKIGFKQNNFLTIAKLGVKDYKIATDAKGLITVSYVIMNKDEGQKNIISDIYKKGGAMMAMYTEPNNVKGVTEFTYEATFLPFEIKDGETITINARNSNGDAIQSIELVYSALPPLTVETKSLPDAVVGAVYSQKFSASGGKAPYKWKYNALLSKNFPAGMKLDEDGTLSGTPTTEGEYVFHMILSDSLKDGPNFLMSLKVAAKPAVVVNNPPSGGGGGSYSGGSGGGGGGGGSSPSITPKKDLVKTFTFSFKTSPIAKHKDLKGYTLLPHVSILVNGGVMSGYSPELFGPNDRLTRAQFLKMVVHSFKLPIPKEIAHNPCKDVARKAWYAPYFSTAKSLKIITAFGDGSCLPDQPITRAEATKILFNAIAHIDGKTQTAVVAAVGTTDVNPFKDISPKDSLYKYVVSAQKYGFVSGLGKNIFDPNGTLTRGQGAKILVNALNKLAVR